jgi:hypothetical protein
MRPHPSILAVILVLAVSTPVFAQDGGTWVGAGLGGGWTRVSCSICQRDRSLGPTGYFRFGTTIRPGLLVGAQLSGWTHRVDDDLRASVGAANAAAYMYPNPAGGFYLSGGIGWVHYTAGDDNEDRDAASNLFGLLVGLGYEFRIGSGVSATNFVNLLASSFGSLGSDAGNVADDMSLSLLQVGIGLTWR